MLLREEAASEGAYLLDGETQRACGRRTSPCHFSNGGECDGARILGLPKSDGTNETPPKRTLKGADGESDDGSPGEAAAYLTPEVRRQAAAQCQ